MEIDPVIGDGFVVCEASDIGETAIAQVDTEGLSIVDSNSIPDESEIARALPSTKSPGLESRHSVGCDKTNVTVFAAEAGGMMSSLGAEGCAISIGRVRTVPSAKVARTIADETSKEHEPCPVFSGWTT
jgi:hypothetical protein